MIDNQKINLQLWDLSGNERFIMLISSIIRDCNIVIFMYDITNKLSFENVHKVWIPQFIQTYNKDYKKDCYVYTIGNKFDKATKHRKVSIDSIEKLKNRFQKNFIKESYEISSLDYGSVHETMLHILTKYIREDSHQIIIEGSETEYTETDPLL